MISIQGRTVFKRNYYTNSTYHSQPELESQPSNQLKAILNSSKSWLLPLISPACSWVLEGFGTGLDRLVLFKNVLL